MKRFILILVASISLLIASAVMAQPVSANVNNFTITSYDIDIALGKNGENHSTLKTVETITANFPTANQNRGIERAIPKKYNGHSTGVRIQSVTDEQGTGLQYSQRTDDNDNLIVRIGNPSAYVTGIHTYVITYTQEDVTRFFSDTNRDEWYWDTNGVEWRVPITNLTITATIDESLVGARESDPACYIGASSANGRCSITQTGGQYTTTASNLSAGENVTLALGFKKGTFVHYTPSIGEMIGKIWQITLVITLILGSIGFIILLIRQSNISIRKSEWNPIAPEYIPPKDVSVLVAGYHTHKSHLAFSAQIVDWAIRRVINIHEIPANGWPIKGKNQYEIEILVDIATLSEEEQEVIRDMFNATPTIGTRLALKELKKDTKYAARLLDNPAKIKKLAEETYGLREKAPDHTKTITRWGIVYLVIGILTISPIIIIMAIYFLAQRRFFKRFTDKGLALYRYILGLDMYIKAAEADRLAMLQGPDTAQKVGSDVDVENPTQLVKLYERVLPYAILFNRETEWSKQLEQYYQVTETQPQWYAGQSAFNAAAFAVALSSISSSASGYTSSSSSGSGGSGGGGFSGGGGGGGGGGGW